MPESVLIVEDSRSLAEIYNSCLIKAGYPTRIVHTGAEALASLREITPRAILLDLKLPDMNGLDILRQLRARDTRCAIIVITGQTSLNVAIEAMQAGADDFVAKPVNPDRLTISLANAIEKRNLQKIVTTLQPVSRSHFEGFIGKSPNMQVVYRIIESAASSSAPVFITGESGTGKEVAAQAIHNLSDRKSGTFVALNCAAIPHELLESEIFGHIKGSFTGATGDREGAASRANGGTLFLDELAEMPINLQSKLLRFIQTGAFSPVGSSQILHTDIRFISATNRNPAEAITKNILREDLYYRLAVIPIELPPLRERGDDVLLLAEYFLEKSSRQENKNFSGFTAEARTLLGTHNWPGNVRELENTIRRAVIMNTGDALTPSMLTWVDKGESTTARGVMAGTVDDIRPLEEVERDAVKRAIHVCNGNITEAARRLGLNPSTIHRKLRQWQT